MIAAGNEQQQRAWNGDDGIFWAENADRFENNIADFQAALLAAADVRHTDHVLDVGCGTGGSSRDAARLSPSGRVLGVDLSRPMIRRAEELAAAAGLDNLEFLVADAQVHDFPSASFDLVMSRMAVMFFADPAAGLANLARALRADGRLAVMTWQAPMANEWISVLFAAVTTELPDAGPPPPGAPGPFAFADFDRVSAMLKTAGLRDIAVAPVTKPMLFGSDVDDALAFVTGFGAPKYALTQLDPDAGNRLRNRLRSDLELRAGPAGVTMDAAAWIYTARR